MPIPSRRHYCPEGFKAGADAPGGPSKDARRLLSGLCTGAWAHDTLRGEPGALCG